MTGGERTHDEVAQVLREAMPRGWPPTGSGLEVDRGCAARPGADDAAECAAGQLARGAAGAVACRASVGGRVRQLDMELRRELLALFSMSAGDYLDNWFESDPIKAVYGFDGIVGNYASPYTPGSAYVLLHHVFGEVNGKRGAWGHAIGGMGAITQAMATLRRGARRRHPPGQPRCARCWWKVSARSGW